MDRETDAFVLWLLSMAFGAAIGIFVARRRPRHLPAYAAAGTLIAGALSLILILVALAREWL
jgi:alpha/beta superfamily hydrolase